MIWVLRQQRGSELGPDDTGLLDLFQRHEMFRTIYRGNAPCRASRLPKAASCRAANSMTHHCIRDGSRAGRRHANSTLHPGIESE
jgi:hypothetical protein